MQQQRRQTGDFGEELAARRMRELGYTILCRNYRRQSGEIDIIAAKDGVIYFTEVKTRSSSGFARPADNVTAHKRGQIARTAAFWFQEQGGESASALLIAEICLADGEINLFEDFLR